MSFLKEWKLKLKAKKEQKANKKYKEGLKKTSLVFSSQIKKLNKRYKEYNDQYIEELEEILITSDMGMKNVVEIIDVLRKKLKKNASTDEFNEILIKTIINLYKKNNAFSGLRIVPKKVNVILMVGVNGTGKTTTAAKLAYKYKNSGKKVLMIAADTFRAGAVLQLEEWTSKLRIDLIKPFKSKQDPASLVYQGLQQAINEKYDIVLIDTAGRLQNKVNLMNELNKIYKIIKKLLKRSPCETLLVLDSVIGQNGLNQAKIFSEVASVSGIVLTKMDGSAKGGVVFAIKRELNIPVKLIGLGEKVDDLEEFNIDRYVYNLLNNLLEN